MKSKPHATEQIIGKLRRADIELGKGRKVLGVCKLLSITEQIYYRWRQKYGGMAPEMATPHAADRSQPVTNWVTIARGNSSKLPINLYV